MRESAQPLFFIGQRVHHKKFDYRGAIIDVDAEFTGTEEWYQQVALSRPPKDRPWYHVLVHNSNQMTYVAERHLEPDSSDQPIDHPAIDRYFDGFDNGVYRLSAKKQ
ncbi:MAG: heat shock protein HspQ [Thiotrichales bacterium]|nr:MAG: heat shock protein HspQ [Thiotrichales bacterium]